MLILFLAGGLVAATSLVVAARVAEGSVAQWLVAAYVLAFAEIVVASLALSPFSALRRGPLLIALAVVFVFAAATLRFRPPPVRPPFRAIAGTVREPAVAIVATVVFLAVAYSVALGLFRPPNDQDALAYHLARAAFWTQQHAIGFIPGAKDVRLDKFAPNSEIAMAFTMVTSHSGRYAPLVELSAAVAAAAAIYGIARRFGFGMRESALSGLLFVTLPAVALQMSTGLNDVVVASLVATTAFFLLRGTGPNLALAGISTALLVGTKVTGVMALPGLLLLALVAKRHKPVLVLGAGAIAVVVGSYWYIYASLKPGAAPGNLWRVGGGQADIVMMIGRGIRLGLAAVELPGAVGLDRLFYVGAAVVVVGVALARPTVETAERRQRVIAAGAMTLAPLVLVPLADGVLRTTRKIFFELGRPEVGNLDASRSSTKASPIFSWYGPLGVILTLLAIVLAISAVRRRRLPAVVLVAAVAPLIWIVVVAITVGYFEWNGRYTMGGFALGAAAWAAALRFPAVAWASAAIAVLTVTLSFVHLHDRPSGLRLLEPTHETSVWSQPPWSVQATDHPDFRAVLQFVDEHVPNDTRIAVEPSVVPARRRVLGEMLVYAFFGQGLERHVDLAASPAHAAMLGDSWAVLRAPHVPGCSPWWHRAFRYKNWLVLRRSTPTARRSNGGRPSCPARAARSSSP